MTMLIGRNPTVSAQNQALAVWRSQREQCRVLVPAGLGKGVSIVNILWTSSSLSSCPPQ